MSWCSLATEGFVRCAYVAFVVCLALSCTRYHGLSGNLAMYWKGVSESEMKSKTAKTIKPARRMVRFVHKKFWAWGFLTHIPSYTLIKLLKTVDFWTARKFGGRVRWNTFRRVALCIPCLVLWHKKTGKEMTQHMCACRLTLSIISSGLVSPGRDLGLRLDFLLKRPVVCHAAFAFKQPLDERSFSCNLWSSPGPCDSMGFCGLAAGGMFSKRALNNNYFASRLQRFLFQSKKVETYENPKYFFRMPVRFFLTGQFLNAVAWNSDIKLLLHHFPPNPMNDTLVIIRVILITNYTSILSGNHMQTMKQTHWKFGMFTYSAQLWNWNGMPPRCGWSLLALESRRTSAPLTCSFETDACGWTSGHRSCGPVDESKKVTLK